MTPAARLSRRLVDLAAEVLPSPRPNKHGAGLARGRRGADGGAGGAARRPAAAAADLLRKRGRARRPGADAGERHAARGAPAAGGVVSGRAHGDEERREAGRRLRAVELRDPEGDGGEHRLARHRGPGEPGCGRRRLRVDVRLRGDALQRPLRRRGAALARRPRLLARRGARRRQRPRRARRVWPRARERRQGDAAGGDGRVLRQARGPQPAAKTTRGRETSGAPCPRRSRDRRKASCGREIRNLQQGQDGYDLGELQPRAGSAAAGRSPSAPDRLRRAPPPTRRRVRRSSRR